MPRTARPTSAQGAIAFSFLALLGLSGCSANDAAPLTDIVPRSDITVQGHVHGGAYPIGNALVQLMETQGNGYGGSAKVLTSALSNQYGYFSFDNYAGCDAGHYVYVTVSGGSTASGSANGSVLEAGVIGSCSVDMATQQGVQVWISELSTVAAAYALGNFISITPNDASGQQQINISAPVANYTTGSCSGVGTAMTCTAAGLPHAFVNARNLVDSVRTDGTQPTGQANLTLPSTAANTQATVPQAMINTIGNILQTCVDSAGLLSSSLVTPIKSDGSSCGSLFEYASTPAGVVPSNTLQAALNIARNPTHNVDQLFNLQPKTAVFTPTLANDTLSGTSNLIAYTISIFYNGTGLSGDTGIKYPVGLALDADDSAYILYTNSTGTWGALDGLANNGTGLFAGTHQTGLATPSAIAIDNLGYAWVTSDTGSGGLYGLYTSTSQGGSIFQTVTVPNGYASGVATDMSNNVWVSRDSTDNNQSLFRFTPPTGAGSYASTRFLFTPAAAASVKRLAVDANQNVWGVTSSTSGTAAALDFPYGSNGVLAFLASSPLASSGGFGLAISKNLEAYFPISQQVDSADTTPLLKLVISNAGSYTGITSSGAPADAALDGAGDLFWTDFQTAGQIFMLTPSTGNGAVTTTTLSGASVIGFQPCFVVNNNCDTPASGTWLRGMALDSSGAMWTVAQNSDYAVVQTLGLAAPTWPLLAYAHASASVQ